MSSIEPGRDAQVAVDYDPFAGGALSRVVPTTEPQREMWLADQLGQDASLAYNESVSLQLKGPLEQAALRHALQTLLDRHDALRANLGPDGETLCIREQMQLELELIDLSANDPAQREARWSERRRLAVETPFALGSDRLFRSELLRLGANEHVLILTAHHIVCDGWSWWVLVRELGALYTAQRRGSVAALPAADDFADYALLQARHPADAVFRADENYWLAQFAAEVPVLELPTDRPRPARRSFASAREDWVFDAELLAAIRAIGAHHGVSLFATLLASFAALLSRLSSQERVVIGIPTAGQAVDGHDHLVGHCVNTLPLLFDTDLARPAGEAIAQAQATLLDALEHQRYTFGTLLRRLHVGRDASRLPLVSVMFNIDQALDHQDDAFGDLQLAFSSNARSFENFEISINAVQTQGELRLECQYNRDLFDTATIRQWLGHWQTLLQALVSAGDGEAFGHLPLLADIERRKVLEKFNDTRVDYPGGVCIHELVEAQVERTPHATALSLEGATLSYAALNARANQLAHQLRQLGAGPDRRVAICAERSVEMVVGLLAILKAGAAYVPLDPGLPDERLAGMLEDCEPLALLTQQACRGRVAAMQSSRPVLSLDEPAPAWSRQPQTNPPPAPGMLDSHLAYVIYTSGSTGLPKGAMNEHRGVVNRLLWMQGMFSLGAGDAVLQKTPYSFDVSVWEFFWPLMTGARLVLAKPDGHKDPQYLAEVIRREKISTLHFVPSMLHAFLEQGDAASCVDVKRVVCSGEALPAALVEAFQRALPGVGLHNLYGPTEAAVDVTAWDCAEGIGAASVPIGRPVANTRIYILDRFGQPVPVGVTGEIFIGGVQVGRGYLNRDALTRERFLDDPFVHEPHARMYRTGDLGRWRADGNIDYLGRNDFQVKLRGFRIELGEIENRLAAHHDVAQAVVITREHRPGDVRLVAYVVVHPGARPEPTTLSAHLRQSLPQYMVPQHYVLLETIPLSPNGKVDRKNLPPPVEMTGAASRPFAAPRDEIERRVAAAMAAALGLADLGPDDDFFEHGGHSLLATRLIAQLNREFGLGLSLRTAFDAPTVRRMAAAIRELESAGADVGAGQAPRVIPRLADRGQAPLSLMQQRLWYLEQMNPGGVTYNTPSAHRLRGAMDEHAFEQALRAMVRHQPVLRTAIEPDDRMAIQRIHAEVEVSLLPAEDLTGLPRDEREQALQQRLEQLIAQPFELGKAPLFRARLFRLDEDEHVFFFMTHHLIWDGWSFDLMYEELSTAYAAICAGRPAALAPLAVEYGDFAAWQAQWMYGDESTRQVAHWRERLAGALEPLELPADRPRPPRMSGRGGTEWIHLSPAQADTLRALGQRDGATLYMLLLTVFYVLLHRLGGQRDLIVRTPVRGRDMPELEPVMGFFVNALPLRATLDPQQSFRDLLMVVRGVVIDAFSCPDLPFERLVAELGVLRDDSRPPICQAMFSFQDARQRASHWGNLEHERVPVYQAGAADDIGLWFVEHERGMSGGLVYNADLFDAASAARFRDCYVQLLASVLADPSQPVSALELLPPVMRAELCRWNATEVALPVVAGVHELFERQARRAPGRVAVRCGDRSLGYAELDARANRIAHVLRERGARRGVLVGIALDRGVDLIAAVLAVLKTGAGYVPLDPTFPAKRLDFMVADSALAVLVTQRELVARFDVDQRSVLLLDDPAAGTGAAPATPLPADADAATTADIAYVIYTSGSTGQPKGVEIPHRAVVNFLAGMRERPGLREDDRLVAVTTLSFDIAVLELLGPLSVGGEVIVASHEQSVDGDALRALLADSGANLMQATPATWRLLLEAGWSAAPGFRIYCGGEALTTELATRLLASGAEVWNLYGPTETTVWSTCWRVEQPQRGMSIGTPIANTTVWILDAQGQACPVGVPGEIWIGGAGVARGYHHRPELTAERFVADPHGSEPDARMYRTGDRGRWLANGQLEHLGRLDFQVKVRGFRIELGEIEAVVRADPALDDCVVVIHDIDAHDRRLVLYAVSAEAASTLLPRLRARLSEQLPAYMQPQHLLVLGQLPRTPNGKVDRQALPPPPAAPVAAEAATGACLPADPRQRYLAALWCDLIGVAEVRPSDNFFDVGGHSLLGVELASRVRREKGVHLNLLHIATGTLASLASELPQEHTAEIVHAASLGGRLRKLLGLR